MDKAKAVVQADMTGSFRGYGLLGRITTGFGFMLQSSAHVCSLVGA